MCRGIYSRDWTRPPKSRSQIDFRTLEPRNIPRGIDFLLTQECRNEAKFKRLAEAWQADTATYSSMAQIAMHPAYQNIIGMGKDALPFLLKQLKSEGDEPHHWFWALAAITGENPVPKQSRGKIVEMAKAWLEWGRQSGYVKLG